MIYGEKAVADVQQERLERRASDARTGEGEDDGFIAGSLQRSEHAGTATLREYLDRANQHTQVNIYGPVYLNSTQDVLLEDIRKTIVSAEDAVSFLKKITDQLQAASDETLGERFAEKLSEQLSEHLFEQLSQQKQEELKQLAELLQNVTPGKTSRFDRFKEVLGLTDSTVSIASGTVALLPLLAPYVIPAIGALGPEAQGILRTAEMYVQGLKQS